MEWISVKDRLPAIDENIILFDRVVQEETFFLDSSDNCAEYFWSRCDLDEGIAINDNQMWQPLPPPPKGE